MTCATPTRHWRWIRGSSRRFSATGRSLEHECDLSRSYAHRSTGHDRVAADLIGGLIRDALDEPQQTR